MFGGALRVPFSVMGLFPSRAKVLKHGMMIKLCKISIRRGARMILSDLSHRFMPGTLTVLRAPNGGGKTTLLRALAGLIPLAEGTIQTEEDIVFCGHLDAVKSAMTVRESLYFWQRIYDARPVSETLDMLGLNKLLDTPSALLSAGQKRRLGLARGFLSPARIKLLDEPTNALDRDRRAALFDVIDAHVGSGGIVILSTHDAEIPHQVTILDLARFKPEPERHAENPFLSGAFR